MFRRFRPGRGPARRSAAAAARNYRSKLDFELLEDRRLLAVSETEPNGTLLTADVLGSEPFVTVNDAQISAGNDDDVYRYTAHHTGKLVVNLLFDEDLDDGDLDLEVLDRLGNTIASSATTDQDEQIIIPVVAQQVYFIRVTGFENDTNFYDLEVENFAAPAPSFIDLTSGSDTGASNTDNVTSDSTPTFFIQADLQSFAGQGITRINQAVIDPNNDGNANDATDDGAGVYVSLINLTTGGQVQGFASQVGPTGLLWSFTSPGLGNGEWYVSAAVQIVDGSDTNAVTAGTQRATGRAQLSDPLLITIDVGGAVGNSITADLLASSDSGMFNDDNVTAKMEPAFVGMAPVGSIVRLYVIPNGQTAKLLVGQTVAGSDTSDVGVGAINGIGGLNNDGIGLWEITVEPLADNGYDLRLEVEDAAGNVTEINPIFDLEGEIPNPIDFVIDTLEPNTPLLDLIDDSGRHNGDNITRDNTPRVTMTSTDPNIALAQLLFTDNLKFRIFDRFDNNAEFLLYDSAQDTTLDMTSTPGDMFTSSTFNTETLPEQFFALFGGGANPAVIGPGVLADGVHNLKLEVEDRAGNFSHDFLLTITVDTVLPPVSFGLPDATDDDDGLSASSDSGTTVDPTTYADRITNDTTPSFWGRAEANSIIRLYHDDNGNGVIDLVSDTFLGQAVALPFDGNDAYPNGHWEITSTLDLNQIVGLPKDGLRRLLVTAEDVAGNPVGTTIGDLPVIIAVGTLEIFIDTQGPQVFDPDFGGPNSGIHIPNFPDYDLFDPKPSINGYTPLIDRLTINVRDLPIRVAGFTYEALVELIAEIEENYSLVGDHVGAIDIVEAEYISEGIGPGTHATARVILTFANFLPDDRYTFTISDNLVDPAGNKLDGESGADEPDDDPDFPSGDGVPGGSFVARFTVDSRPEIGSWVAQDIDIDINGNFVWDPANGQQGNDSTHVDISWTLPVQNSNGTVGLGGFNVHDLLFAGKFRPNDDGDDNGEVVVAGGMIPSYRYFDQLAAYGNSAQLGAQRWIVDLDSDGVVTLGTDILTFQPLLPNLNVVGAIPVAGNFDGDASNGDEIGLYNAGRWGFDYNRNFVIDANEVLVTNLFGAPIVGDFDGDGTDDLAVFNSNVFSFDLAFAGGLGNGIDDSLVWGFPGVLDKPVAADIDQDGIDDIGLWVPRTSASVPAAVSEWYFLVSNDPLDETQNRVFGTINQLHHAFKPVPFGFDISAEFGDSRAQPIVGNFDPPVTKKALEATFVEGDYNGDSRVDQADYAVWKSTYGSTTNLAADGNQDGKVNAADYSIWRNAMDSNQLAPVIGAIAGDYDSNGQVGISDYTRWKTGYASTHLIADGNGDGTINAADYTIWRNNLGATSTAASGSGGLAGSSLSAVSLEFAEEPVANAVEFTELPYFVLATAETEDESEVVGSSDQSEAELDSLLLLVAGQPRSDRDEALGDFGSDQLVDSDDRDGEPSENELAMAAAWQTWDEL